MEPIKNLKCLVLFAASTLMFSCGSPKNAYPAYQTRPSNDVQSAAANRGVKLEVEECEELASDLTAENPREFGNGTSAKESFATNLALLDARSKMAQRIKTYVQGAILSSAGQTQDPESLTTREGNIQTAKWEEYVTNTRVIKKNTYVKENGQYNVYVCIEMPKEELKKLYDTLSQEKIISAQITEQMFREGIKMISTK